MVNRVLITPEVAKVSAPGWDVLTAPYLNLQFSTEFSQGKAWMKGSKFGERQVNPNGISATVSIEIPYGRVFSYRPMVIWSFEEFGRMSVNAGWGSRYSEYYDYAEDREWLTRVQVYVRNDVVGYRADADWYEDIESTNFYYYVIEQAAI